MALESPQSLKEMSARNLTGVRGCRRARGSVAAEVLCYKPEGRGFDSRWSHWFFLIYLIFPAALDTGVYLASNRNEYQKQKQMFLWSKARSASESDITTIIEPIVYIMWDP
jgi:hypothetical protein